MARPSHPGNPTQPLRPGAPLSYKMVDLPALKKEDIEDELTRARVELLNAIARHRKAWAAMEARALQIKSSQNNIAGLRIDMASDPIWSLRTSDVQWWCQEMAAQSSAVLALTTMLASHP